MSGSEGNWYFDFPSRNGVGAADGPSSWQAVSRHQTSTSAMIGMRIIASHLDREEVTSLLAPSLFRARLICRCRGLEVRASGKGARLRPPSARLP
jgi:hypothetical protein